MPGFSLCKFFREPQAGFNVCFPIKSGKLFAFRQPGSHQEVMMIHPRFIASLFLFAFVFMFSAQTFAQDRTQLLREIDSLKEQLKAKEKEFLDPSPQEKAAFTEFLNQPDTGLIRLMPRETNQNKLSINGSGAYYSFARLTHEYGFGSDISLERDMLSVGFAGADFGFLTSLNEVSLESVNQQHPALEFLVNFTPSTEEPKARESKRNSGAGFQVKEFTYRRSLLARVNTTYAVRSVNYGISDILAVFRVLRKDSDGSLIIAWKLIKLYPTPELIRP
jgi:hypothetical protein